LWQNCYLETPEIRVKNQKIKRLFLFYECGSPVSSACRRGAEAFVPAGSNLSGFRFGSAESWWWLNETANVRVLENIWLSGAGYKLWMPPPDG